MHDNSGVDTQSIELATELLRRYDETGNLRPIGYEWNAFMEVWREATGRLKFNTNCGSCISEAITQVRRQLEVYRSIRGQSEQQKKDSPKQRKQPKQ